jgi:hypothetical protein
MLSYPFFFVSLYEESIPEVLLLSFDTPCIGYCSSAVDLCLWKCQHERNMPCNELSSESYWSDKHILCKVLEGGRIANFSQLVYGNRTVLLTVHYSTFNILWHTWKSMLHGKPIPELLCQVSYVTLWVWPSWKQPLYSDLVTSNIVTSWFNCPNTVWR